MAYDYDNDGCRECCNRQKAEAEKFERGASTDQPDLFGLTHRSTWPRRLETERAEGIFYRRWLGEQRRNRILHHILRGEDGKWLEPTDRDSIVAASVVQWFGTNVGRGFISSCERELGFVNSMIYRPFAEDAAIESRAHAILSPLRGINGYGAAVAMLQNHLQREDDQNKAEIDRITNNAVKTVNEAIKVAADEIKRIRKDAIFGVEVGKTQRKINRGIALKAK